MHICMTLVLINIFLLTIHGVFASIICLHDEMQEFAQVVKAEIDYHDIGYDIKHDDHRRKRSKDINYHNAIRIQQFWDDFRVHLPQHARRKLQKATTQAIEFTHKFLYVIPVTKPLLFKRSGCRITWTEGNNTGKCAMYNNYYREELCGGSARIPDDHLEKLYVWKKNETEEPVKRVFEEGSGINSTDFALYIGSSPSSVCFGRSVLGYAGYCQLDQLNRPIAGYINICPNSQLLANHNPDQIFKTVLHELFHALGFSKTLFDKFRDCSLQGNLSVCPLRISRTIQNIQGITRLVTKQAVNMSQRHFGCYKEERYGIPLHKERGRLTSHWHPRLMYSSIMTPRIGLPHLTFIDPMTLALFEDTGWYKVDYSVADPYFWGKDAGCSFGLEETCTIVDSTSFFCQGNLTGCHYLHKDKGVCTIVDSSACHVMKSKKGDECSSSLVLNAGDVETHTESSLCLMANLTKKDNEIKHLSGECYRYRCSVNQTVEVKVMDSQWIVCPYGNSVTIQNYSGLIQCPNQRDAICPAVDYVSSTSPTPFPSTSTETWTTVKDDIRSEHKTTEKYSSYSSNAVLCTFSITILPIFLLIYEINR